ncbi:hypothetical protein IEQ44_05330 [Nocardioides sp. Y6]|uniref:DUF4333 domain-containing protein n=1 Tax=Nocardioides malaquae TaxID=2773426 RepID=A0ABR9RR71_9ACTN|nr:hypothetical protein [Nocardioides malaquae]MBE7324066.1 hypothetical protein [Nocardioides malaquae]
MTFLVGLAAGWIGFSDRPEEFDTTVVKINADRTSVCVDRAEDSCGVAVIEGSDVDAIKEGTAVTVQEFWLQGSRGRVLAFYVQPQLQ